MHETEKMGNRLSAYTADSLFLQEPGGGRNNETDIEILSGTILCPDGSGVFREIFRDTDGSVPSVDPGPYD